MRLPFLFALLFTTTTLLAQEKNLVSNGSFEELDGKIKQGGVVEVAEGWKSTTGVKADLFSPEAKTEEYKAPSNKYGREKAMDGDNYAGIIAYAYKGKSTRSYITGTVSEALEAGKQYCVKMNFSLSDLSKYAVNNLSAVIHDKDFKMEDVQENILMDFDVRHSRNKIVNMRLYWQTICGVYTAEGGEKFITIGNFGTYSETESKKLKKPIADEFKLARQIDIAYYFVDNVSIVALEDAGECDCEEEEFVDTPEVVKTVVSNNVSMSEMMDKISAQTVQFEQNKALLTDEGKEALDQVAEYLELNGDIHLNIVGNISAQEQKSARKSAAIGQVGFKRADICYKYLIEKGIDKKRLQKSTYKHSVPRPKMGKDGKPEPVVLENQEAQQVVTLKAFENIEFSK